MSFVENGISLQLYAGRNWTAPIDINQSIFSPWSWVG